MAAYEVFPAITAGSRRRITIRVDFGATTDLASLSAGSVKVYMRTRDFATLKINGADASGVTDVSSQVSGAPAQSVWDVYYDPIAADVDTPGHYLLNTRITFSGGVTRYYPDGDYVRLTIKRNLA